jgi:hypothetical protein
MHHILPTAPGHPIGRTLHISLVAALFWLFTFALLSFRTHMVLGDDFTLFTARRILAISAGAAVFGLVLSRITDVRRMPMAKLIAIIATILPASVAVLAARLLLDRLFYDQPLPLENNIRWVLVWAGYFGLWVSACLALNLHASSRSASTRSQVMQSQAPVSLVSHPATAELLAHDPGNETWEWLVDALAVELAAAPPRRRARLLEGLLAKAGYELADERDPDRLSREARVELVQRLLLRSAEQSRRQ